MAEILVIRDISKRKTNKSLLTSILHVRRYSGKNEYIKALALEFRIRYHLNRERGGGM